MAIRVNLDVMLAKRKMSVGGAGGTCRHHAGECLGAEERRAKAIRFSTLDGICEALECQPGDVLEWIEE